MNVSSNFLIYLTNGKKIFIMNEMFSIDDTTGTMTGKGQTIKIDLADYAKTDHHHRIIDVDSLETQLASKATIEHTHKIDQVEKLRDELNKKSDTGHTHDIRTISNSQNLPLLNDVNVIVMSISKTADDRNYIFSVDEQGNLNIFHNDLRIGQYVPGSNDWILASYSLKEIDTTLENHYQALLKIKQVLESAGLITNVTQ